MKINIIGGGPAGMYFAILMKQANPAHEINIYERNGPDDTFGWGVVFSGKTLTNLRAADEVSHAEITRAFAAWDNVDVVHGKEKVSIHGNSFSGVGRLQLLKILQGRCEQLGIQLHFKTEVPDVESLRLDCDLLVAADGVNSTTRRQYSNHFQPTLDVRPNRYIWYGTNRLFHGLTLTFRENEAGVFAAHSYKFNQTTSTFIIECDEKTWQAAGFATMSDEQTREYLQRVFAPDLEAQPLLSNKSQWINFLLVKNQNWFFENVVMIGDALHTAHFSIGSGTKLALEDAIALFKCFQQTETVGAALREFASTRKPVIEEYQAAAFDSMVWFENAKDYMKLSAVELAYVLMTRSGRVDHEDLKRRDPAFMAAYESERGNCFRKGTLIKCVDGWKEIESLRTGELVWTHRGRLRPIVGVQHRPHVGRLVGLCLEGATPEVWCTPEQRFLIPFTPSPQAERGKGGEESDGIHPTPFPSPLAGRGESNPVHRLGGSKPGLAVLRRNLRSNSTDAEILLWDQVRGRKLCGAKFRRQHSLGPNYIVDFYCAESQLAIELDGSVHDSTYAHWADGIRHRQLHYAGVRVLRFSNQRVIEDLKGVLREISECLTGATGNFFLENWRKSEELTRGDKLIINESGDVSFINSVKTSLVNEMLYDLIVKDDASFVTSAGVVRTLSNQD